MYILQGGDNVQRTAVYKGRGEFYRLEPHKVVEEVPVPITVNGRNLATVMLSPVMLEEFVTGFLFTEQIISEPYRDRVNQSGRHPGECAHKKSFQSDYAEENGAFRVRREFLISGHQKTTEDRIRFEN